MKSFFLLCSILLFSVSFAFSAFEIKIADENPTTFQVGERAFVAVKIVRDDNNEYFYNQGYYGNFYTKNGTTISPYELEIVSGNADWLYPQYRPAYDLSLDNAYDHWQNNQYFWMELSGKVPNTANGTYTGTVQVKNTVSGEIATANYSFQVVPNNNNLSVVMYDAAASYNRQMEIRSYIKNNSNTSKTLNRPYMDYYLTKAPTRQIVLNVWSKPSQSCVQVLDCGNNNYIIRHRFIGDVTINSNRTSGGFQIGYNERIDNNNSSYYDPIPEKNLNTFLNENEGYIGVFPYNLYLDYSYAGYATNYTARAMRRNEFFNPYMALFETGSQTPLYGTVPDWVGSHCAVKAPVTSTTFNPSNIRTYESSVSSFCTDQFVNQPPIISFESTIPDVIYEGEDYVAFPILSDPDGDPVTLTLVSGPFWLEVGTPSNYDVENWPHHPSVGNVYYVRSVNQEIRQRKTIPPGLYSYTLEATDGRGGKAQITRQIQVLPGKNHPSTTSKKLAVLMGDETWFRKYQLDVASGIVNFSDGLVTLTNFYYDYYGFQAEGTTMRVPQYWYSNPEFTPTYTDCGERRFRIRYQYNGTKDFYPHSSYFDNKAGIVYAATVQMNKNDDWSFTSEKIYRREYNANMPLYNGDGTFLWGNAPHWAGQCGKSVSSSSSSGIIPKSSSSGTAPKSSSSGTVPKSSSSGIISKSSSSGAILNSSSSIILKTSSPFKDLSVRFYDNLTETNRMNFFADVYNKGRDSLSLSGYEMRFYFNDYYNSFMKSLNSDASDAQFTLYYSPVSFASNSPKVDRCQDGKYVLNIKFNESAAVNPSSSYPSNGVIQGALYTPDTENAFNKMYFASWNGSTVLKDNPNMALFDESGHLVYGREAFSCDEIPPKKLDLVVYPKELGYKSVNGVHVGGFYSKLSVINKGDSSVSGPVYLEYYVRHPYGQVPVLFSGSDTLSEQGKSILLQQSGVYVERISAGDLHTYRFMIPEGLPSNSEKELSFTLYDACIYDCGTDYNTKSMFKWNYKDDWSVNMYPENVNNNWISSFWMNNVSVLETVKMTHVLLLDSLDHILYGVADPSSPSVAKPAVEQGDQKATMTHSKSTVGVQEPNRTDAIAYSLGQLLSGGDFEDVTLPGWTVSGLVKSVRGNSPQGSRFVSLGNASISQKIHAASNQLLADSGAVLILWHKGMSVTVSFAGQSSNLQTSSSWRVDTLKYAKNLFNSSETYELKIQSNDAYIDDIVLIPGTTPAPSTYAVRFTNMAHEEMETRAYDGDKELLITTSVRDFMGRLWKKFLPFALPCSDVVDCNSNAKTLDHPTMAENYYIKANPDYPDAGGYPFVETRWKPDQAATKDVSGAPGKAYSLDGDDVTDSDGNVSKKTHLVRAFSSGVNLDGVDLLDSLSLNSAVSAVQHTRLWDSKENYHAASDLNPTHLWELSIDPDGRMAFTVKDGESKVVVSGALNSDGRVASRSVNELDVRGNVIKSHPPLSCEYTPQPVSCVSPSTFEYDSESRVVKSVEPDASETRSYYDVAGRVRATQTQRQIDSGVVSVRGYDHLDRPIYTGVWKTSLDSGGLRSYFNNVENRFNPTISELEAGTVTRTYYDRMPARDTLGVELYSADLDTAEAFKYNRGRVVATISDVVVNEVGDTLRHSVANVYDKRGRVIESYIYNGSVSADSLKMVSTATEYDLAGKILQVTKYPYGLSDAGKSRKVVERYSYDRLGRVDTLYVTNGRSPETVLAAYEYYPTGSVQSVKLGNTITLDYEYHISGAVKSAVAYVLDNSTSGSNGGSSGGVLNESTTAASSVPKVLYSETLYYEDCDSEGCTPQYNGNISRMVHHLAHGSPNYSESRDVAYAYDMLNRLTKVEDDVEDYFDEIFNYDAQGRIVQQRRGQNLLAMRYGGEYSYYTGSNQLEKVMGSMSIDDSGNKRDMSADNNFLFDRDGNMIEDKSKKMTVKYDHRGLPVEFKRERSSDENGTDSVRLVLNYNGAGSRISKIRERKSAGETEWTTELATHYTGIGSEIREDAVNNATKVVVNLPQGLGRYDIASASEPSSSESSANTVPSFEWYLKNHLGSTMLVYGTNGNDGSLKAAYDYRAFGEQVDLTWPTNKVTETFTGKELDDETDLSYFGARYLDQMLGMWVSVDAKRQFNSPYLYAGNGTNPVNGVDPDGNIFIFEDGDEVTPALLNSYYTKLSPEAKARYNQLDKSKYRYYVKKVDGVYPDKDFNDDEHFLGGEAVARTFVKDNGVVSGGEAKFANARYFLHEVLQHLFDFDNELKATNGDTDAVMNDYTENKDFYEQKAVDFEDPSNMQGVDLDAY